MMDLTDSEKMLIEAARRAREAEQVVGTRESYSTTWAVDIRTATLATMAARDILDAFIAGREVA